MRRNLQYNPQQDYYQVIGVETSADADTLQRAYRQKAKEFHPDLNPDREEWATEQFQLLNDAYSILSDPQLRRQYNDLRWAYFSRKGFSPNNFSSPATSTQSRPTYTKWTPPPTRPYKAVQRRGNWLEDSGLGWARPFYVMVADLLTSPYRYVMLVLGAVLVINGFLIFGGFFSDPPNLLDETVATQNDVPTSTLSSAAGGFIVPATIVPSVTPVLMPRNCEQYAIIHFPADGSQLTEENASLIGTVNHPNLYAYQVDAEYLGDHPDNQPQLHISLRQHTDAPNSPDAPRLNAELAPLGPLMRFSAGYYEITLTIRQQDNTLLAGCTVTVYKAQ